MRTVQVQYSQKGKVWLDDINVPVEIVNGSKWNALNPFISNTIFRKYGQATRIELLKWYN